MLSFLSDELVWAAIREREDEARATHPHTTGWPEPQRSMASPNPLRQWMTLALRRSAPEAAQRR